MPEMNRLDFVHRAKIERPHILFFLPTGHDISEEIKKALRKRFIKQYFQNPFHMTHIDRELKKDFKKTVS